MADGHAGWADAGEDVVCAAVSAILQAAWLGLTEVAKIDVAAERAGGSLTLAWPEPSRDDPALRATVGTAEVSIAALAGQFPDHVRFSIETEPAAAPRKDQT